MSIKLENIVDNLLSWFDENKRSLPWRDNPEPYYVWVSEIMLQQTRVEAVKGYFDRFIQELPTLEALANAEEERLLKLWEGLGYYNRVRNLNKAARIIMEEYHGVIPKDYKVLMKLPGIGSYTAGAIASIAYNERVPAVDGNVLRITKRLQADCSDISKQQVVKEVEKQMQDIIPKRAGDFNQALMDLGATICIPNGRPLCEKCPVREHCQGFKKDVCMLLPVKPSKKPRKIEDRTVVLLEYDNKLALHRRGKKGLLAGLWELPNIESRLTIEEVEERLEEFGVREFDLQLLGRAKHIFSHIEWNMLGYHVIIKTWNTQRKQKPLMRENGSFLPMPEDYTWVDRRELTNTYALPSAFDYYKIWNKEEEPDKPKGNNQVKGKIR